MKLCKKMFTCMAIVLALISMASALHAQGRGDTAAMRKQQEALLQQAKADLKLTDVQADSLSAIHNEFQSKMRDIFMDPSLSREDKRAKIAPINEERNKRLKAVMGPDLFKQYQDWMQAHRPQRGGGGGGRD